MEIQLYNYFRSSASYRVRIALHYKGLEFIYKPIHLIENGGQQYSPEYKKLNPSSEVPALAHDGQVICQSVAIIEYLDEVFPNPALYPKEPGLKARTRQLCEIINCVQPMQNLRTLKYLETGFLLPEEQKINWLNQWIPMAFQAFEENLKHLSGKYCIGDHVTAADLFLIPQIFAVQRYNIDTSKYPLINKVNNNCLELECFKKAHPFSQPDTPSDLRR